MKGLLVVISGLPATGKSTLATGLAERLEGPVLSRDHARQEITGPMVAMDRRFTRLFGRYRRGLQQEASRRLERAVADELAHGMPVVVEVVAQRGIRQRLEVLAEKHGARICSIEVICGDPAELARRLGERRRNWRRIVARMAKSYRPASGALVMDSSTMAPTEMVNQAMSHVCPTTG
jgi:predicted kinase